MREHGVPQFTVDGHRPVGAFDLLGVSFATELGYTNLLTALDLAGIPLHAADRTDGPPDRASPAGTPRSTRSRSPTSSTRPCSATARRRSSRSPTSCARWKQEGSPGGRDEILTRLAETGGVYVPRFYDVSYTDGALNPVTPNRDRVPGDGRQAHHDGPRRVAVPEAAAGAARGERARADERGDLPRLHPGLPVLPGRHDHPAGARAVHRGHRRDGPQRTRSERLRGGRPAVAVQRGPLGDRRDHQGPRGPVRGHADRPVAAVDPGRRVQHRPGERAVPQRPPLRADVRAGGRQRADPPRHQQDGVRGGPHPDGQRRVRGAAGGR